MLIYIIILGFLNLSWVNTDFEKHESKIDPVLLESNEDVLSAIVIFNSPKGFSTKNNIHGKSIKGKYVFNQLIKRYTESSRELDQYLSDRQIEHNPLYIINGVSLKASKEELLSIASLNSVKSIIENSNYEIIEPKESRKSDRRTTEWGIDKIRAPDVWNLGYTGANVVVGGQDTGVEWDHEAIKNMYRGWDGTTEDHDYNWHDAIHNAGATNSCGSNSIFPCDDHGHGTHTIGTMIGDNGTGKQIGVAPDAKWIACRNMDKGYGTLSTYLECFEWFIAPYVFGDTPVDGDPAKAPHVINNSWGCPTVEGCNISNFEIMRQAVENVKNAGIVVVVSAGNSGSACGTVNNPAAIFEESFSVGATTSADAISSFSSRGPVIVDGSYRLKPNVSAPGSAVYSCIRNGNYATWNGTSMAGPHVAGAVALIISANPNLAGEVDIIENIIEQTSVHLTTGQSCNGIPSANTPNNTFGYGRIDVLAAVNLALKENHVPLIKVDHFGYKISSKKIAILSDPIVGFNNNDSYTPGSTIELRDALKHTTVYSGSPVSWNSGSTHAPSGDKVWQFDFSNYTTPGIYYLADGTIHSEVFEINDAVYNDVLSIAQKSFYYQRCGTIKDVAYVGSGYEDGICHSQDINCKFINDTLNIALFKDMSGGWHDAGDYNKYVNYTDNTLFDMLLSFEYNQEAWGDDTGIPESGNDIPDLIDEIKVELDWLKKMQDTDGGVYCMVGVRNHTSASPPSADISSRFYAPKTTSASLATAGTFALAAIQFQKLNNTSLATYANNLELSAEQAWNWADANPEVIYNNNGIIGSSNQEVNLYTLHIKKLIAAIYLYDLTGKQQYKNYVNSNYTHAHMMRWGFVYPFENEVQLALLYYAHLKGVSTSIANDIKTTFKTSMDNDGDNMIAMINDSSGYLAHINPSNFVWGSNRVMTNMGELYYAYRHYKLDESISDDLETYKDQYLHYIHGRNPIGKAFISNMATYGSDNSCNSIYHLWFKDGSSLWDDVFSSTYGPPPGFIPGGVNPSYSLDDCCATTCNSHPDCITLTPPSNQPAMKSYLDWNTSYPQNSWEITEPAIGYQASYLFLLSSTVNKLKDIDDANSSVIIDTHDLVFPNIGTSIVLRSSNNNLFRITVNNEGELSTTLLADESSIKSKIKHASLIIANKEKAIVLKSSPIKNWELSIANNSDILTKPLTTFPTDKVEHSIGDILIDNHINGLILKDIDGVCYKITVNNDGALFSNPSKCHN